MSLRPIDDQIALELAEPDPAPETIVRIWLDESGKVQSERVPRETISKQSTWNRRAA